MKYNGQPYEDKDNVNSPEHYTQTENMECIDAIDGMLGDNLAHYYRGAILKYLWRYEYKGGIQDLEKAQWYLQRLIKMERGGCGLT